MWWSIYGDLPECQIQATDEPVQFFTASDNGDLANDFGSLEWRIDDVFPGAGSAVSSPGIIDPNRGIVHGMLVGTEVLIWK